VARLGVASGAAALDPAAVARFVSTRRPAILIRRDTVTSDYAGIAAAAGILTASGGRTSRAAVVARQIGKVCLVACPGLAIDLDAPQCRIGGKLLDEGNMLAIDGNTGAVYAGNLMVVTERPEAALAAIARWPGAPGDAKDGQRT
jgi:pyruvate,orthophosphate dikinase